MSKINEQQFKALIEAILIATSGISQGMRPR